MVQKIVLKKAGHDAGKPLDSFKTLHDERLSITQEQNKENNINDYNKN